jgi:4-amino-4-deoxy-L-arabinose transferase-like glycosyltransferase
MTPVAAERAPERGRWRAHRLFIVVLLAGAALRVVVSLAYYPALLLQRDAYTYLRLALDPDVGPARYRPSLYPAVFLDPLLATGELAAVPIAQHLLGLALAVGLYLLMVRAEVPPWMAALGTVPVLLDGYQVALEHYVLTETFFVATVVVALGLLTWPPRPTTASVAAAGLLVGLAALTRFVGAAVLVPVLLFLWWRRLGWGRAAAAVAGFAAPLLLYSAWFYGAHETFAVTDRNGLFLYGRVASFADCARFDPPERLRELCFDVPPDERGPNLGVWTLEGTGRLARAPDGNARALEFSRMAIAGQPADYARVVLADLVRYFEPASPPSQEPFAARWRFPVTIADAEPHPYVAARRGSAPPSFGFDAFRIDVTLARTLRAYQTVAFTWGPLLGLFLALGIGGGLFGGANAARARAAAVLFSLAVLALLVAPVTTAVYHFRYVIPALALAPVAAALGATALSARARRPSVGGEGIAGMPDAPATPDYDAPAPAQR